MRVFVAIIQPDGDWDHQAEVVGTWADEQKAKEATFKIDDRIVTYQKAYGSRYQVILTVLNESL